MEPARPSRSAPARETRVCSCSSSSCRWPCCCVLARFRVSRAAGARSSGDRRSPGPLERLAARATYDDLAAAIADRRAAAGAVGRRRRRSTRCRRRKTGRRRARRRRVSAGTPSPPAAAARCPAIRLGPDLALGARACRHARQLRRRGSRADVESFATDPKREIALVRVPSLPESATGVPSVARRASRDSATSRSSKRRRAGRPPRRCSSAARPVGRRSLAAVAAAHRRRAARCRPASLVFALDGRFIGLALPRSGGARARSARRARRRRSLDARRAAAGGGAADESASPRDIRRRELGGPDPLDRRLGVPPAPACRRRWSGCSRCSSRDRRSAWRRRSRRRSIFLPLGALLGPRGLGCCRRHVLERLDVAVTIALAVLGVLVGVALGREIRTAHAAVRRREPRERWSRSPP